VGACRVTHLLPLAGHAKQAAQAVVIRKPGGEKLGGEGGIVGRKAPLGHGTGEVAGQPLPRALGTLGEELAGQFGKARRFCHHGAEDGKAFRTQHLGPVGMGEFEEGGAQLAVPFQGDQNGLHRMAHHLAEQRLLAGEVVVEGLPGDLGAGGDALHAHLIALLTEGGTGGFQQPLAGIGGGFGNGGHGTVKLD